MKRVFKYANMGTDAKLDSLVEKFDTLLEFAIQGKNVGKEYETANYAFNEAVVSYTMEQAGKTFTGLDDVKNPQTTGSVLFKDAFTTVLAQLLTPAIPKISSSELSRVYDVYQTGFGDNAKYTVDSNEMFIVTDGAEGIKRGGYQTTYNDERTITASKKTASAGVNWYQVASGKFDWGMFGAKTVKAFEIYIQAAVSKVLNSLVDTDADRVAHGIGGYFANGLSDSNWMVLARNVKNANGGSPVYAVGTGIALTDVIPEQPTFRFMEDSDIVKIGWLPAYKGVQLIEMDNAMNPYTINSNAPASLIKDNFILMIAAGTHKPIKVLFEGNSISVMADGINTADNTLGLTIDLRIGIDVVIGSKFGIIKLA